MVYFWHRIREKRADIFVTIHDSIDVRVHKDDVAEVTEMAKLALTSDVYRHLAAVYNYRMRVPLGLGFKSGKHWNEGEELKWDIFPDGTEVSR